MDGLVFIVVIVLFSLLEGVLRKQKAAQQARLSGQAPDDGQSEDGRYGLVQDEQFEATYGGEPSYDDGQPSSYDDDPAAGEYESHETFYSWDSRTSEECDRGFGWFVDVS